MTPVGKLFQRRGAAMQSGIIRCRRMSVCLSVTRRYCIETAALVEMLFARRFPSTYLPPRFKDIRVSPKRGYFPMELCPKLWNLKKIVHGTSIFAKRDINNDRRPPAVDSTRRQGIWRHGGRGQVISTSTDGRRLCVQRDGRLGVRQRCAVHSR